MDSRIEIELSKSKAVITLLGALLFVVLGAVFMSDPDAFVKSTNKSLLYIRGAGALATVFFGLCVVYITRKLFDKKPGLIIDKDGIIDNSNAASVGLIEWEDIIGLGVKKVKSTRFLVLYTRDPEKYIRRIGNPLLKMGVKLNHSTYGSPIAIISNSLKIKFDDLETLISTELEKREIYD